jgi:Tn3 transposase DDE domain
VHVAGGDGRGDRRGLPGQYLGAHRPRETGAPQLPTHPTPRALKTVEQLSAERIEPVTILDVLTDIDNWLQWTRFFGLLSGRDARMKEACARYVATTFCYGCNLGPTKPLSRLVSLLHSADTVVV